MTSDPLAPETVAPLLEELAADPQEVARRCFEFLGVDPAVRLDDPGVHLNSMREYRLHHPLRFRLFSSPASARLYASAARALPSPLRARLRRLFPSSPVSERPRWDDETRRWAWERIGDDVARFLEHYGHPAETWSLPS